MLENKHVPEGVKEQLRRQPIETKNKSRKYEVSDIPEDIIFAILSNNNPYDLLGSGIVSKQFNEIISRQKNLNLLADIWKLSYASSVSNLADLWKTSHVTKEYLEYCFADEVLIHYIQVDDEKMLKEAINSQEDVFFGDIWEYLVAVNIMLGRNNIVSFLIKGHKSNSYPDSNYYYNKDLVLLALSEEYYNTKALEDLTQGITYNQTRDFGKLIKSVQQFIPEEAFRIIYKSYIFSLMETNDFLLVDDENGVNKVKMEIISEMFSQMSITNNTEKISKCPKVNSLIITKTSYLIAL